MYKEKVIDAKLNFYKDGKWTEMTKVQLTQKVQHYREALEHIRDWEDFDDEVYGDPQNRAVQALNHKVKAR